MRLIDADVFEENMDKEFAVVPDPLYAVDKALENTPTIDVVEVVHAKWVRPTKIGGIAYNLPHCSACQEVPCDEGKYCPNCGARMDGEQYGLL